MKHCNKCGEDDQEDFSPSRNTICSRCEAARVRAWQKANPEKEAAKKKAWRKANFERDLFNKRVWRKANLEKIAASSKAWRKANPEKNRTSNKTWKEKNVGAVRAQRARRRAAKLQRTPVWSETENIKGVYLEAQRQQMQVDHIIPLKGKLVSGLHVWGNLQLLTPKDNHSKGNKFDVEKFNSWRD
jgi:5-methylcytosine-specific restriction endonuclease McrA